jgi:leucyl aminopeptidase
MPLQINVRSSAEHANTLGDAADVVIIGLWTFADAATPVVKVVKGAKKKAAKPKPATVKSANPDAIPELASLDARFDGAVSVVARREEFKGKREQQLRLSTLGKLKARTVILLGVGDREGGVTAAAARACAGRAARAANAEKAVAIEVIVPEGLEAELRALGEGLELGAYRFTKYLTGDRKPKEKLSMVTLVLPRKPGPNGVIRVGVGQRIGDAVNLSRDLSNEPPNELPPSELARAAQEMAKGTRVKAQVFDGKEILRRKMFLLSAVGQGSSHDPRFVHLSYVPEKKAKKCLVFVGKGITFDSGGISIKPAAGMGDMKHDMSGAANMVGLMAAVAVLEPRVEVHALMACAENMPDGNAYRPGDVFGSLDGKTVEIVNTDAEGRLVLADALAYAKTLKPDLLVNNATLTGACLIALGSGCSAFYATSEEAATEFATAVKEAGESMWRMPLIEELREAMRSDVADIKHTGDRYGGSITGALFLRDFIGDVKNFIHADIAGPATTERPFAWNPKGATGHGVLTYLSLVERAAGR